MPRELLVVNNQRTEPRPLLRFLAERGRAFVAIRPEELPGLRTDGFVGAILSGTGESPAERPESYAAEMEFLRRTALPVLGICGGFQVLCLAWGGTLGPLSAPRYGRTPVSATRPDPLFTGLPEPFVAFTKHRFQVTALPASLTCIARSVEGGIVYGARHRERPQAGVQFHPERHSDGDRVLDNFLASLPMEDP